MTTKKSKAPDQRKVDQARKNAHTFAPIGSLFDSFQIEDKGGYITQEFQDFGYRMAVELDDLSHKSLYMRIAKKEKRGLLEKALSFVADAPNVKSKGKLFMWKLQQLKRERSEQLSLKSSKSDKIT